MMEKRDGGREGGKKGWNGGEREGVCVRSFGNAGQEAY